ncbi:hypothetical protein TcasGA2_TC032385 [Tribolium castaneum]|uniref:Uncharacterized protein n=1 Tax=Tribolium castaneum TaxID=7070 RepID=A0A139WLE2_TRICA|nr:hypothetical protein TcasGA2_TC032385 [Tribolium castaneum]
MSISFPAGMIAVSKAHSFRLDSRFVYTDNPATYCTTKKDTLEPIIQSRL